METYLEHYGVLGMKWGVRKDPEKAYRKSMNKLSRLDKKVAKREFKSAKLLMKSTKKEEKAFRTTNEKRYVKRTAKALKYKRKSAKQLYKSKKAQKKAKEWVDSMNEYFANTSINSISTDDIALGKKYAVQILNEYLEDK